MKRIKHFRVYADRKRKRFYRVFLFPNKEAMYAFERVAREGTRSTPLAKIYEKRLGFRFEALTTAFTSPSPKGQIGYLLFYRDWLGSGIVAHELTHAALHVWQMRRRKFSALRYALHSQQEEFCMLVENMTIDFWRGFYRKVKNK